MLEPEADEEVLAKEATFSGLESWEVGWLREWQHGKQQQQQLLLALEDSGSLSEILEDKILEDNCV